MLFRALALAALEILGFRQSRITCKVFGRKFHLFGLMFSLMLRAEMIEKDMVGAHGLEPWPSCV